MVSLGKLKKMYADMMLIRYFEEKVDEYAKKGIVPGFVHLGIGQEACQVGVVHAIRSTDYKYPDHRCHGAVVLFGTDIKRVMAEIMGRQDGINGGRGGSMHISDLKVRNMGNNGIQGSNVVSALGPAFYSQLKKTDDITIVFMGDGTLGEGACHESINLAAVWKLPVIYILVNNQYAISTHYTTSHPQKQLATWADGYNVPQMVVDGNDVEKVYEAVAKAAKRARKGKGPTVLELMSYRWQGHFSGDPAAYRPEEEVQKWIAKCPILKAKNVLIKQGVTIEELKEIEEAVKVEVNAAVKFSLNSPKPKPEDAMKYVYAGREVQIHNV